MHAFGLPALASIASIFWHFVWICSFIYLYTVGEPVPRPSPLNFITIIPWSVGTRWAVAYHILALFWVNAFIFGTTQFIIGASACFWYFEVNSDSRGKGTVSRAYTLVFRYHIGSIAFGSLLIAICKCLRVLFDWYRRMLGSA